MIESLDDLAKEVIGCRRCDDHGIAVEHPPRMERGSGDRVLVVGIEPGRNEIGKGKAFSGLAGSRLMEWLKDAGIGETREQIFQQSYFTSLIKCKVKNPKNFKQAFSYCVPFLIKQIEILKPSVFLPLGQSPISTLFGCQLSLEDLVGNCFSEAQLRGQASLTPLFLSSTVIIPLPHPSPLSRWLNNDDNKKRLSGAIMHIANNWRRK